MTTSPWLKNVVLVAGKPLSSADVGGIFDDIVKAPGRVVKSVSKTVGRTATSLSRGQIGRALTKDFAPGVSGSINETSKALRSVPAIGSALDFSFKASPMGRFGSVEMLRGAAKIASGEKVNRVVYDGFKEKLKGTQEVLPFVSAIIGMPGVGKGAEATVASGNAVSKGLPIGDKTLVAIKSALPPEARAGFDAAFNSLTGGAITGKNISAGAQLIRDVVAGKKDGVNMDTILANLPPKEKQGVKLGYTVGLAKTLQAKTREGIRDAGGNFLAEGQQLSEKNTVLKLAAQELRFNRDVQEGFYKAVGFLSHKANPTAVDTMRDTLSANGKKGFDIAASIRIGQVAHPTSGTPRERVGYYLTKGSLGMNPTNREALLKNIKTPEMLKGVRVALNEDRPGVISRFLAWLMGKELVPAA